MLRDQLIDHYHATLLSSVSTCTCYQVHLHHDKVPFTNIFLTRNLHINVILTYERTSILLRTISNKTLNPCPAKTDENKSSKGSHGKIFEQVFSTILFSLF